ncbi:BTB/POZ domain-containing protein At3g19850 [Magnolia sinica]|uniref:BTB/POZ domain-containing protein At3g19850 n=1 Tax=Magnolia sinica TaxID=86752 RepID=UPI002658CBCD|nr:BTB/POZ domain-containing protein At3g19850 [Magnolia sinica]
MQELCDLKVHINGQHTFFLNQKIISSFSGKLEKMIKQENKKTQIKINGFPGGPHGFELATRFCYNNGRIQITPSNISILYCSAIFLEMTEEISSCNLLQQTETFLDGLFYWTWADILESLKACDSFFSSADSSGLLQKLISSLLVKINANSDSLLTASSSSSSSSPETPSGFRFSSSIKTPDSFKRSSSNKASWWFDDLTILPPMIIGNIVKAMDDLGPDSNTLIIIKFLLHYLKTNLRRIGLGPEYRSLADIAVDGVVSMGKSGFSCRGLFWVLRVVSGVGPSRECRSRLEALIGGVLDQATLDDLLVSGHDGGVYDVNLVLRLIRVFVNGEDGMCLMKLKKVGRLIDKYMGEISPDQSLKVSKFLAVAESLPDSARDCYDGVYRAIDIYLESHPMVPAEERARLCRCLNYEKLTLEACKYLAKSPKIPPRIAIQALSSQQSKFQCKEASNNKETTDTRVVTYVGPPPLLDMDKDTSVDKEEMRLNLLRMQFRVMELENVCREMKGQMSKIVKDNKVIISPGHNRSMPKLC